ncbi:MAG: outer membrane protein transport protein [Gemmatimonadales bacterium]|nr:outer membrane protein transport protein [Gemmatimonadales bacterium]
MTASNDSFSRNKLPVISRVLILLGLLFCAAPLAAQTPFALTNIGQKIDSDDARMVGRGGWGMAVYDSINPGFKNTAGLSVVRNLVVSLIGYGSETHSESLDGQRNVTGVMVPEIRLAAPVVKGRLAVTTGFSLDRNFRYDTVTEFTTDVRDYTLEGEEQFIRQGTLFAVPFGVAWEAAPGLSLGAVVGLVRGTNTESLYEVFREPVNQSGIPFFKTVLQVQDDTFEGTAYTLSALYRIGDRMRVGASYTPSYTVDADRSISLGGVSAKVASYWSMTMPEEYLLGTQTNLFGRWWLGCDYQFQAFSEFEGPQAWVAEGMEDEYTVSVGLERRIANVRRAGLSNWPLRLGYSTRQWAYRVDGEPLTENTLSLGTGFPFRRELGMLDLALSYSRVGDLEKNGLEDSVWKISISVTGLERWW